MAVQCPWCRVENRKPGLNCVNCGKPMSGKRLANQSAGEKGVDDEEMARKLRKQWIQAIVVLVVGFLFRINPQWGFVSLIFGTLLNITGWVLLISVSIRYKLHKKRSNGG